MGTTRIKIGMGEGDVARGPHVLCSAGIGSCVVVALYDARRKTGAMAHVMLPDSAALTAPASPFECADTAVPALLEGLRRQGSRVQDLVAKIAGGARMFESYDNGTAGIGGENVRRVKEALERSGIPLAGWDVAGHHGRSVEFHLVTGRLVVKAIGATDRAF